jgi:hypothetical protein
MGPWFVLPLFTKAPLMRQLFLLLRSSFRVPVCGAEAHGRLHVDELEMQV